MNPSDKMIRAFSGRTVILTGSASGIGRSMARLLLESGAIVHALDIDAEGLASLDAPKPGTLYTRVLDVTDRAGYQALVGNLVAGGKVIHYLFNNAGVTQLGEAQNISFERWKWLLDINLMGVINGTQLVYPVMIAQGHGHIINTASIAGSTGYATAAAYTTSKAAVLELTRSLDAEAKRYGVRISAACPGYVDSGIFSQDRVVGADVDAMIKDLPVKMMTPDNAAFGLLKGVVKKQRTIVFPLSALFLWHLSRWAPSLIGPFHRRFLRVFQEPSK